MEHISDLEVQTQVVSKIRFKYVQLITEHPFGHPLPHGHAYSQSEFSLAQLLEHLEEFLN